MIRNIGFINHKRKQLLSNDVEKKLKENNSLSLEEILSEDSLIDELQGNSQIIINYLTKEKIKQIIDYIIKEPPLDAPHDRGHKFPWVCTQLFTIENSPILKYLYKTNKELKEENKENNDKMDLDNNNNEQSNNNNIRNENRFNYNNINNNENNNRERRYGQGARNRSGSQEPSHFFDNFINNIFGGIFPMMNVTPIIISTRGEGQPYNIYIQSQNVPQNIFDPVFLAFGSIFDNNFRNNYSSNFRSNFRGNFLEEIIRILERNQEEAARKAHPPTSESALKKLKRFNLSEKYCKKDKKGKIELPSCCICISDIEMKEETVLLPCGHMFHWNCCLNWLKGNNTCPMCRFVIKD